jgi:hypothetical protein
MYRYDKFQNNNPLSCAVVRKVVKWRDEIRECLGSRIPHDGVSAPRQLDDHWYGRDGREGSLPVKELEPFLSSLSLPFHAVVSTVNVPFLSLHLESRRVRPYPHTTSTSQPTTNQHRKLTS